MVASGFMNSAVTFGYGTTCMLSYYANTFVLYVLLRGKNNSMKLFLRCMLILMTIADLLQTLLFIFPMALTRLKPSLVTPWLCNFVSVSRVCFSTMSMLTITIIGIERFRCLRQLRADPCGRRQLVGVLVSIIGVGIAVGTGRLLGRSKDEGVAWDGCNWEDVFSKSNGSASIYRSGMVWVMNGLTWISYLGVTVRLIQSNRDLSRSGLSNTALMHHRRRTLRVTFNCVILAFTFTLCWTPLVTVTLLHQLTDLDIDFVHDFTLIPALLTCVLNPAINGLMMKDAVSSLKQLVCLRLQGNKEGEKRSQQSGRNFTHQKLPCREDQKFEHSPLGESGIHVTCSSICSNPSAGFGAANETFSALK